MATATHFVSERIKPLQHVTLVGAIGALSWIGLAVGGSYGAFLSATNDGQIPRGMVLSCAAIFLLLVIARLVIATMRAAGRRLSLGALTAAVSLWIAGAATVNDTAEPQAFPAPGELLFLASYAGFVAFIILDASHRRRTLTAALDATIVCATAASLMGAVLITPLASVFPADQTVASAALIFPILDICLMLLIGGQWILEARRPDRRSLTLMAGFGLMAVIDASLVISLAGEPYGFGAGLALLWGAALMLIVDAATTPRRLPAPHERRLPAWFLVASVVVSVMLLAVHDAGDAEWAITVPALVTILAAAGRLSIALRDAREAAEARRLITTDEFTDLPNRRGLIADLNDRMTAGEWFGLILLDIDDFEEINHAHGREISDQVLQEVATRMQTMFPTGSTVARIGGDDFVAVVPGDDVLHFIELANEIRASLLHDTHLDGHRIALRTTLGIAQRMPNDTLPTAILARADAALHDARQTGAPTLLYDPSRDEFAADRRAVSAALRAAIAAGGVSTWYAPTIDSRTQELLGLEAFPRWDDPISGRVPLGQLLSTARRDGLMLDLTEALLRNVLNDMRRWRAAGRDIPVTISVAAPELLNEVLLPTVYRQIASAGLPARALTIAVPQEVFISEPERARLLIHDMARAGLRVATVEDGDGFSSLGFLKDLPIAELKMGRSFLAGIGSDPRERVLVASTVATAHALNMIVVIEGVDTDEQRSAAISANVDGLQGNQVGASMPAATVIDRLLGNDQPIPPLRIVR